MYFANIGKLQNIILKSFLFMETARILILNGLTIEHIINLAVNCLRRKKKHNNLFKFFIPNTYLYIV